MLILGNTCPNMSRFPKKFLLLSLNYEPGKLAFIARNMQLVCLFIHSNKILNWVPNILCAIQLCPQGAHIWLFYPTYIYTILFSVSSNLPIVIVYLANKGVQSKWPIAKQANSCYNNNHNCSPCEFTETFQHSRQNKY